MHDQPLKFPTNGHLGDVERVAGNIAVVHNLHVTERVHFHTHVVPMSIGRQGGGGDGRSD